MLISMNLQMIKNYCENREGGVKQLAKDIGMSEPNLHRCIRLNQIQAGDLERIAQALNVNISVFFNTQTPNKVSSDSNVAIGSHNSVGNVSIGADAVLAERVKSLEALLAEKERLISVLMEVRK
jgi:DNA-binding Xre family transcriptional regulator